MSESKVAPNYVYISDEEIIQHCKDVCNKHGTKDESVKEIQEWSNCTPSIAFNNHPTCKEMFMFMGMIFSPTGKILRF
jgi:hypothetical protein